MTNQHTYSNTALYARYRWDYAAEAIQTILQTTAISLETVLADTARVARPPYNAPMNFYYGSEHFVKFIFPFHLHENWEHFFGGMCSASNMPDRSHPAFSRLENAPTRSLNASVRTTCWLCMAKRPSIWANLYNSSI